MLLVSIQPKYVDLILAGTKRIELRRQVPRVSSGPALIYASSPRKELVASFQIAHVLNTSIELMWQRVQDHAGVTREAFDEYYTGAKSAVGIWIKDVKALPKPIPLVDLRLVWDGFHPPQSFRYIDEGELSMLDKCDTDRLELAKSA